jgi:hypothetical protein
VVVSWRRDSALESVAMLFERSWRRIVVEVSIWSRSVSVRGSFWDGDEVDGVGLCRCWCFVVVRER